MQRLGKADLCFSRRQVLSALAGAGAMATCCANAAPHAARTHRIDTHHHFFPPFYLKETEALRSRGGFEPLAAAVRNWNPERSIAEMDKYGIETGILSVSTTGIWFGDVMAARSLSRRTNEYAAQMARDYPNRFGSFATIPLPDVEGSLKETEYALDVLKADGIGLLTSYDDKWPGHPSFAPVFEELNRRNAVVYFHPASAKCCSNVVDGIPGSWTDYPHDTTRAITSLLNSGALTRYRNIRFLFSHAGGTLPGIAGRIIRLAEAAKGGREKFPNGVLGELQRLFYDTAISTNHPSSMAALMALVPISQIVFGSDYPQAPSIGTTADGFERLKLSDRDRRAIERDNALALLKR